MRLSVLVALVCTFTATACDPDDPTLEVASKAILDSSEACLLTVRDQKTRYAATPACTALSALASGYIAADHGGKAAPKYQLRFVEAQRMAWTALAMSETNDRTLRIW